jgi:hypothetical protein
MFLFRGEEGRVGVISRSPKNLHFTVLILSYLGYVKDKKLRRKWWYVQGYSGNSRERQRLRVSSNSILIFPRPLTCIYHISVCNNHYIVTVLCCYFEFLCFVLTKPLLHLQSKTNKMQSFLDLFISINSSICFRRFLRLSSGAQNYTYNVRCCQTNTASCCYRGWDGTTFHLIHECLEFVENALETPAGSNVVEHYQIP